MKEKFEIQSSAKETPVIVEEKEKFAPEKLDPELAEKIESFEQSFDAPETRGAMTSLVEKLKSKLENPEQIYDTLLSDEASGRLVTLFLRNIINKQREKFDKEPAKTFFIAGGGRSKNFSIAGSRHWSEDAEARTADFIAKNKAKFNKTLLITEYIVTGHSIKTLSEILDKQGIQHDIATVSIEYKNSLKDDKPSIYKKLYFGSIGGTGLIFYRRSYDTGVEKLESSGPFPSKIEEPRFSRERKTRTASRIVMRRMSNEIYDEVFKSPAK